MEPDKCEGWQWITWSQLQEYAAQDLGSGEDDKKMLFKPMVHFATQNEYEHLLPSGRECAHPYHLFLILEGLR